MELGSQGALADLTYLDTLLLGNGLFAIPPLPTRSVSLLTLLSM